MKGSPAVPGGSLTSRPTWSNVLQHSTTSAFFVPAPIADNPFFFVRLPCNTHSFTKTRRI